MAIHTESIPPFRSREERDADPGPSMREIACRRCGLWMHQRDDRRWYHSHDDSLACVDPATLTPYDDDSSVCADSLSALRSAPQQQPPDDPKESTMSTNTLNLTTATPAELRAECDRLGVSYRSKDDRKALSRKIIAATSSPSTFEGAVAAVLNGADPIATADALVGGTPEQLNAKAARLDRMKAAKAEAATMKAWRKAGAKGTPPSTPNLDALNAESASAPRKANGAKQTRKSSNTARPTAAQTATTERYAAARATMAAERAAKTRRTGSKLDDDAVKAYIGDVLAKFPDATCGGELLVARWTERMSMDRYRWNALWAAVVAS